MSAERRLHPLSILFGLLSDLRSHGLPGLAALVAGGIAGLDLLWIALVAAAYLVLPVTRYLSWRYRFDDQELVVRSGLLFRNERHLPYGRIHHVDATQNALHRLLGVVDVRLETGSAGETEARLSVLPRAAVDELRAEIHARVRQRTPADDAGEPGGRATTEPDDGVLLRLGTRDLLLYGLIENRGLVLLAAAAAVLWEYGVADRVMGRLLGEDASVRGLAEAWLRSWLADGGGWGARLAAAGALFLGLLALIRLLSMAWAAVRLHGFRLRRHEDEVSREYGALTRVQSTVARPRIQSLTVREGPLHRLFGRASIDIETAGRKDAGAEHAEGGHLAPILPAAAVARLVAEVLPEVSLGEVAWHPVHPRAFRRVLREAILVALPVGVAAAALLAWWSLPLLAVLAWWTVVYARRSVAHLGWAATADAVFFRSGWWWRRLSIAPLDRVQVVSIHESPFDRRAAMSRLRVDTAGASATAHRIDIPYLPRSVARGLRDRLAERAARTTYRW